MSNEDVLIVGDWYVDAHWVVAPHESETASRPGTTHTLAVHDLDATVRALCGAGQVASILQAAHWPGEIYGIGSWAWCDDGYIQALVNGENKGDNPLKLRPAIKHVDLQEDSADRRVFNLAANSKKAGTNRVIRVYRKTAADVFELSERIDFETEPTSPDFSALKGLPSTIKYVLIKDHGHGIVTEEVLTELKSRLPEETVWFVATKSWNPLWMKAIHDQDVRIVLFQQEAAAKAKTNEISEPSVGKWFVEHNVPTRRALLSIENFCSSIEEKGGSCPEIVAVLPSRESFIARITDGPTTGYTYRGASERPHESFVPRASALFAALFYSSVTSEQNESRKKALRRALDFTGIWVQEEAKRISKRNWIQNDVRLVDSLPGAAMVSIKGISEDKLDNRLRSIEPDCEAGFEWGFVNDEYSQAFTCWPRSEEDGCPGFGLIKSGDRYTLELWRARSEVSDVISVDRARRGLLGLLSKEFEQFVKNSQASKSFMIVDDPGSGKSTIVRQLAKHRGLRVLPVNITELTRRVDLLSFFDTVVTTQAQDPTSPLLIFVDEINALLEGHTVYSSFLAPLEDGHYNRDGKSFKIDPCIWLFVGTDDLRSDRQTKEINHDEKKSELEQVLASLKQLCDGNVGSSARHQGDAAEEQKRLDRAQKGSDFLSRLTVPPLVLNQTYSRPEHKGDILNEIRETEDALSVSKLDVLDHILNAPNKSGTENAAKRQIKNALLREGQALERIYVGAFMIKHLYPSVENISRRVLMGLAYLDDSTSFREIRHHLENMSNIQRGTVRWKNLPNRFRSIKGKVRLNDKGQLTQADYGKLKPLKELCGESCDNVIVKIESFVSGNDDYWTSPGARESKEAD